jgi:hypothetical protein
MKDQFGIPVKRTDKLAPEYIAKHGNQCVEVDAISLARFADYSKQLSPNGSTWRSGNKPKQSRKENSNKSGD